MGEYIELREASHLVGGDNIAQELPVPTVKGSFEKAV